MKVPGPADERAAPITFLAHTIPLPESDDEALRDLELLREIDKRDKRDKR